MCSFCNALIKGYKEKTINWAARSTMADDNLEESLGDYPDQFYTSYYGFSLYGYAHNDNTMVGIDYEQRLHAAGKESVIVNPFSETVQFNFCPMCGEQISKTIKPFEDNYNFIISVEEKGE